MRKVVVVLLALSLSLLSEAALAGKIGSNCTFKGKKLYGKIQFVSSFPDIRVQIVSSLPDVRIQYVSAFPGVP